MSTQLRTRNTIAVVVPFLIFGGGERLLATICRFLRQEGWRIVLHIDNPQGSTGSAFPAWFAPHVDAQHRIDSKNFAPTLRALSAPEVLAVVYFGYHRTIKLAPLVAGMRGGQRQVAFIFNAQDAARHLPDLGAALSLVICESLDVMRALGEMRLDGPKLTLIPSLPEVTAEPRLAQRGEGPLKVGFIGRMDPIKDPEAMLRIAAALPRRGYSFEIIGGGFLARRLRLLSLILSARRDIRFLGHLSDAELSRRFGAFDVLVVPSLIEGRPLVIQEAQRRGIVVLASRVGGIPELVDDGKTGLLCPPGDTGAFVAGLRALCDADLRRRLAGAALARTIEEEALSSRLARFRQAITGRATGPDVWPETASDAVPASV